MIFGEFLQRIGKISKNIDCWSGFDFRISFFPALRDNFWFTGYNHKIYKRAELILFCAATIPAAPILPLLPIQKLLHLYLFSSNMK